METAKKEKKCLHASLKCVCSFLVKCKCTNEQLFETGSVSPEARDISFKSLTICDQNPAFQVQDEQWQKVDGFTTEQNSNEIYYTSVHTFSLARRHGCLIQRRFASLLAV